MAGDSSKAMTQLIYITECSICLKQFTDPRMLPCIHTFCLQCLEDMADKSDKKPGDSLPCPVCRREFTVPNDGVRGLKKNFFMDGMIEVKHALNSPKMGTSCDICKANSDDSTGKIPEATNQCVNCEENLCESCCRMHKSFKVSRNHKIVEIGGDGGVVEGAISATNCAFHPGKVLDYYCAECKKVVCVSCFVESHRTHDCKDVNSVADEFRQIIKSSADVIAELAVELLAKKQKSTNKEDFLMKVEEREKEILRRSEELRELVEMHTVSLLSSLDELKDRRLKEIQAEEDELERRLIILECFSRYCDELRSKGSASDVCRSKEELLQRADEFEEDHEIYIMRPSVSFDVSFQATDVDEILKTGNGNLIGSLKEHEERTEDFAVMIGRSSGNVYSYKINLHRQSEIVPLETVPTLLKSCPAASVYDNTMFITGVGETMKQIWKYNFTSGWTKCGFLVHARECHCAEFIDDMLYICGGSKGDIVMDTIESYNAMTEKTTVVGQLVVGSQRAACVAYNDSIYVFGGFDKNWGPLDCVQMFNPVESVCTLISTPMPRPCAGLRAVLWNSCVILQTHEICFVCDLEGMQWEEGKQFRTDAYPYLFGLVLSNERVFIIDGSPLKTDGRSEAGLESKADVKYVRAKGLLNLEASNWKAYGQLPKSLSVVVTAKLSSTEIISKH